MLRDDGTCWVNLGDSYAATRGSQPADRGSNSTLSGAARAGTGKGRRAPSMFKAKDQMGMPWRVALALQADGWYLRQDIIWAKPNPMPESAKDRCTKSHEYLFLLAKSQRYYFDAAAIEEARASVGGDRGVAGWAAGDQPHNAIARNRDKGDAKTFRGGQYLNNTKFNNSHATERDSTGNADAAKDTRNKRSVWTVATQGVAEAHFATYPPALIEPCVLAGCPAGGTVLDPFGGSGTTGEVAERLGRNSILIELNPVYAELCARRTQHGGLVLGAIA